MMTNISYKEVLYLMAASNALIEKLTGTLKKCVTEHREIICAGLSMMSAGTHVAAFGR